MESGLEKVVKNITETIINYYGEALVSLVLFGSCGRGDFQNDSDIDLMVVLQERSDTLSERIIEFVQKIVEPLRMVLLTCQKEGLPHHLEPHVLTAGEVKTHPPIMLDMVFDSRILFDRDGFFQKELELIRAKLQQLGTKRVDLPGNRWYWILKPGIKKGEVVEI